MWLSSTCCHACNIRMYRTVHKGTLICLSGSVCCIPLKRCRLYRYTPRIHLINIETIFQTFLVACSQVKYVRPPEQPVLTQMIVVHTWFLRIADFGKSRTSSTYIIMLCVYRILLGYMSACALVSCRPTVLATQRKCHTNITTINVSSNVFEFAMSEICECDCAAERTSGSTAVYANALELAHILSSIQVIRFCSQVYFNYINSELSWCLGSQPARSLCNVAGAGVVPRTEESEKVVYK